MPPPASPSAAPALASPGDAGEGAVAAAPENPGLAAQIDGRAVALPFARARFDGDFLWVDLSAAPIACAAERPEQVDVLSFPLPPGPAGDFYQGTPIDLPAELRTHARASGQPRVTVTVGSAEATADAWLEASIAIASRSPGPEDYLVHDARLEGRFRARVCTEAIPAAPPRTLGEPEPFPFQRAFATLDVDAVTGEKSIGAISFTADPRARCGEVGNPSFSLTEISGARSGRPVVGKPQPAVPSYYQRDPDDTCPGSAVGIPGGPRAWVTFDALSFAPGEVIRGSVDHAAFTPVLEGSRAPGRFVAMVCRAR